MITVETLHEITGSRTYEARKAAYLERMKAFGGDLMAPAVFAQITAQVLHESGAFRYDEEIASGAAYEGRLDLGNTEPGDGKRFKGRDLIQVTGRANYDALDRWVRTTLGGSPQFVNNPKNLTSPKWLGIGVVWYFLTRPGLLQKCRAGDIEAVTRSVNGGLNGYQDRLRWYNKTAMALLGHDDIKEMQRGIGVKPDGVIGPQTRAAMHAALKTAPTQDTTTPAKPHWLVALINALLGRKAKA